jgi:hypothetical protein
MDEETELFLAVRSLPEGNQLFGKPYDWPKPMRALQKISG